MKKDTINAVENLNNLLAYLREGVIGKPASLQWLQYYQHDIIEHEVRHFNLFMRRHLPRCFEDAITLCTVELKEDNIPHFEVRVSDSFYQYLEKDEIPIDF